MHSFCPPPFCGPKDGSVFFQRGQHAVEHAEVFVAGVAAGEERAKASYRVWPLISSEEESGFVEGLLEPGEEGVGFFAGRWEIRADEGRGFNRAVLPPRPTRVRRILAQATDQRPLHQKLRPQ